MNIFLAYGYNDRDRWVKDLVFPIIRAFGSEVITGDEIYGQDIPSGVLAKIRRSDALVGFSTRRDDMGNGRWTTHHWVKQELAAALALNLPLFEVRETNVDPQGGITANLQRIDYEEEERDKCLVEIVKALGIWHQTSSILIKLLPEEVANNDLRPLLSDPGLICSYMVKRGNREDGPFNAGIKRIKGGLFIEPNNIPHDALIQINIRYGNRSWSSDYESIDSYGINLR